MAEVIIMPKLGFNMDEGKLVQWYKSVGDEIKKGEPLFSVETDKTNMDIYPHWWYTTDYSIRKKIINQALSKKSRIRDLKEVQDMEHRANINMLFDEYKDFSNRSKKNNLK